MTTNADSATYLTTSELAERWGMSTDAIRQQRYTRRGPAFVRDRCRCAKYPLAEVLAWERQTGREPVEP